MSQMSLSNIKRLTEMSHVQVVAVNFKKINVSVFSGIRRQRWSDIMSPAVLKSLSDRTLVGGGARNFCASGGDN